MEINKSRRNNSGTIKLANEYLRNEEAKKLEAEGFIFVQQGLLTHPLTYHFYEETVHEASLPVVRYCIGYKGF
jgi:hypothetical protein